MYGSGTLSMARSFASGRRVLCATLVLSRGDGRVLALQPFSQFPRSTVRWHQSQQVVHASATADAALQRNVPRLIPTPPEEAPDALWLLNSLTMKNEPFVPIDHLVKWYICGPTVYDSSHIGHARNYVAFDIVRRVMLDYFGFDIVYVMNITDIDDKIILRTHRNHLEKMLEALSVAADNTAVDEACRAAQQVLGAKEQSLPLLIEAQHALRAAAEDAGLEALDVCDVQVAFTELTAEFEREFLEDMAALNVLPPDAITRVSDYVPEIVAYIETILANGYCYEAVRSTAARTQTRGNRF